MKNTILIGLLLFASATIGNAQTPQDERDCRSDAVKLCRSALGNQMAVLACFQRQRHKLARRCQAVLRKYGQ
jgi:hypothetical protein